MVPIDGRLARDRRARRGLGLVSPERLETRDLMAFTSLGFSLPDLVVSGYAGPVATYGGPIAVTVDVRNLGASSIVEPLNLAPLAPSSANAGPFSVGVYMSKTPQFTRSSVLVGKIAFPTGLTQNNEAVVTSQFTLPTQPTGFPNLGGKVYLNFVVDSDQQVREMDKTNNVSTPYSVLLSPALPQLDAIGLELPPVMRAGDTIQPNIKIANYGTVSTNLQAPVLVQLLASLDPTFGPGDSVVASFTIDNILPVSQAPTRNLVLGDANIDDPPNVRTVAGPIVTLPATPSQYFIGLRVDPNEQIRQILDLRGPRSPLLEELRTVGPPSGLPPAGVLSAPALITNNFPIPPFGLLTSNNPVPIFDPELYYRPAAAPRVHGVHMARAKVKAQGRHKVQTTQVQPRNKIPAGPITPAQARQRLQKV